MDGVDIDLNETADVVVGRNLRELRSIHRLSLKALADISGLNINTLSLIENGRSSPSVSTLQRLAQALDVPITHFFEIDAAPKQIIFTAAGNRPTFSVGGTLIENLGKEISGNRVQPLIITLKPGMGSGERKITHAGYEFIFCIRGSLKYTIDGTEYKLEPNDSLVFESQLKHSWMNVDRGDTRFILIIYTFDSAEKPTIHHFK
jgi:transcriptional regulator with XRE-family HTH domain